MSYSATAYANLIDQQQLLASFGPDSVASQLNTSISGAKLADGSPLGDTPLAYLNLVNDLVHGNTVGVAIDVLSIAFPPAAPFLMVASLIFSGLFGDDSPPQPCGNGRFVWNADGSLGIVVNGENGGESAVRQTLQSVESSLQGIIAKYQGPGAVDGVGLIANRLAVVSLDGQTYALTDMDPVTGKDRTIHYGSDGNAIDAIVGSPEYFRKLGEQFTYSALGRETIAPQWEADTARLQTQAGDAQAGLTELQRAQRNGLLALALALAANAGTQTWRPILVDLNGDGVQTVAQSAAQVAFDVDSGGYLKRTAWASRQDGFLVLDRNYNGLVDNGSELFSNALVADGAKGLASMRWVDANGDGDISVADPVFSQLRIWQDANGNDALDDGESHTLNELGVTALHYARASF